MGKNETLTTVPSLKWYKFMICVVMPLGLLADLMFIGMYVLQVMADIPFYPAPSAMSFLFIFMTTFFVFYRVIDMMILTGRISASKKVLIAMHIIQVVYMDWYLGFILYEGASLFAILSLTLVGLIRLILIPVNSVYFAKRKEIFSK